MKICGNCDWASGGAIRYAFCEKCMELVSLAGNCPKWRARVFPEGFLFKSDFIDISHIDPSAPPIDVVSFDPPKEELVPPKRKRAPNKPKVIPEPSIPDDDEDIFA